MSEIYGELDLTVKLAFAVKAENSERAEEIAFEDIKGLEVILKDGRKINVVYTEWSTIFPPQADSPLKLGTETIKWVPIKDDTMGNITKSNIDDFYI